MPFFIFDMVGVFLTCLIFINMTFKMGMLLTWPIFILKRQNDFINEKQTGHTHAFVKYMKPQFYLMSSKEHWKVNTCFGGAVRHSEQEINFNANCIQVTPLNLKCDKANVALML